MKRQAPLACRQTRGNGDAAVKRIAEDREAILRRVNPDLMRATGERLGLQLRSRPNAGCGDSVSKPERLKSRFRLLAVRAADVAFSRADDLGFGGELALPRLRGR